MEKVLGLCICVRMEGGNDYPMSRNVDTMLPLESV